MIVPRRFYVVILISVFLTITLCRSDDTKTTLVNIGDYLSLECLCNTSHVCFVEWKHRDERIMLHDRNDVIKKSTDGYTSTFVAEGKSYRLRLYIEGSENLGSYDCIRFSISGRLPTIAWILKYRDESFSSGGGNTTAIIGEHVIFECSVSTSILVNVTWMYGNTAIMKHKAVQVLKERGGKYTSRILKDNVTAQLEMSDVSFEDAGDYTCLLQDSKGEVFSTSWTLYTRAKGRSDFTKTVPLGESVNFTCNLDKSSSRSFAAITWHHGAIKILHHDANAKEVTEGKYTSTLSDDESTIWLNISFVSFADVGEYSCSPYLLTGDKEDKVTWILQVEGDQNKITRKLIAIHDSVHLDCYSDTLNIVVVKWIHISEVTSKTVIKRRNDTDGVNSYSLTSFTIFNASFEDAGNYFCFSYDSHNEVQETAWTLQIQGRPQLTLNETKITEALNETSILFAKCCVEFGMRPMKFDIYWLMNDERYNFHGSTKSESVNNTICNRKELLIKRTYHGRALGCWIVNELNETSYITLNVSYSPDILKIQLYPSDNVFPFLISPKDGRYITCEVDANPEPVVFLEAKSANGLWEVISREQRIQFKNGSITKRKFSLLESDNSFYRCVASNGYGTAAVSHGIAAHCFWSCIFNGVRGIVLMIVITSIGVIVIAIVIRKIAVRFRGIRSSNFASTGSSRSIRQNEVMQSYTIYENQDAMKNYTQEYGQSHEEQSGILDGDENYSLVTINDKNKQNGNTERFDYSSGDDYANFQQPKKRVKENGRRPVQQQNKNMHRKPTPKPKQKKRLNQKDGPIDGSKKENVLYATVNKERHVPPSTVQKNQSVPPVAQFTSSVEDLGASESPTKAELMYAKVKKNKIWRTDQQ